MTARYVADPEIEIEAVVLDGLVLLYHRPSGMTHIVAPPAPQILEALRLGPAEPGEILARMRAWYALEGDEEARSVEARLEELEQAGLVAKEMPPLFTERAAMRPCERLPDVPADLEAPGRGRRFRDLVDRRKDPTGLADSHSPTPLRHSAAPQDPSTASRSPSPFRGG